MRSVFRSDLSLIGARLRKVALIALVLVTVSACQNLPLIGGGTSESPEGNGNGARQATMTAEAKNRQRQTERTVRKTVAT